MVPPCTDREVRSAARRLSSGLRTALPQSDEPVPGLVAMSRKKRGIRRPKKGRRPARLRREGDVLTIRTAIAALLVFACTAAGENIQKWQAPDGRSFFGDKPPSGSKLIGETESIGPSSSPEMTGSDDHRSAISECLSQADREYKDQWRDMCLNSNQDYDCRLSLSAANFLDHRRDENTQECVRLFGGLVGR
jgi:hypothetical protein